MYVHVLTVFLEKTGIHFKRIIGKNSAEKVPYLYVALQKVAERGAKVGGSF